jgi:hypothetical protein
MVEVVRRDFLFDVASSIILAPAVVKARSLALVRGVKMTPWVDIPSWCPPGFIPYDNSKLTKQQFPELHAWFKRCRQGGAHLSDDFALHGTPIDKVLKVAGLTGNESDIECLPVTLVSTQRLKRSNGSIMQAGASHVYWVSVSALSE